MSSGALLILPLTPRICAFCYDGDVYSIANVGGWANVLKDTDVIAINEHQYLNCDHNVYFSKWSELTDLAVQFGSAVGRRLSQSWEIIMADLTASGNGWEEYKVVPRSVRSTARRSFINLRSIYPRPERWPSLLRYRASAHGFTNGSAEGFVRKSYVEAQFIGSDAYKRHKF